MCAVESTETPVEVSTELYALNRRRLVDAFRGESDVPKGSKILLKGGLDAHRANTGASRFRRLTYASVLANITPGEHDKRDRPPSSLRTVSHLFPYGVLCDVLLVISQIWSSCFARKATLCGALASTSLTATASSTSIAACTSRIFFAA